MNPKLVHAASLIKLNCHAQKDVPINHSFKGLVLELLTVKSYQMAVREIREIHLIYFRFQTTIVLL